MKTTNPLLIFGLILAVIALVYSTVLNTDKEFSTMEYWQTATVQSVAELPASVLEPGNTNGGVLMWAAMGSSDPEVIAALVARGADVNESDPIFTGTPLSAAAGYGKYPRIIEELVAQGADIHKRVSNGETALMVAARYNRTEGIVEMLAELGADIDATNSQDRTALELAQMSNNSVAASALTTLSDD
jgi:ankyrin repeat protein